jgi:hypothetical protein
MRATISIYAAVLAVLGVPSAFGTPTYTFTILNPGGSVSEFNSGGINNNGVVVDTVNSHLFTYNINTGIYTNYNSIFPSQMGGIDDSGKIVYTSQAGSTYKGTIFDPSTNSTTTFLDPNATQYTFANGVSGNGSYIAGYYLNASSNQIRFVKNGAGFTDISYPGPHGQIYLWDTNNAGDILGMSSCCRAGVNFLLENGVYTTILDPLGSPHNGQGYGMNDLDQVVGWYDDGAGGPIHGLFWENGLSTTLDFPGATRTVLHDINDSGVILGGAIFNGSSILFVATPTTPEPGTCVLIGGALLAIGLRLRRRALPS